MKTKICNTCKQEKNISEFYQTKFKEKVKIKSSCKKCVCEKEREIYFEGMDSIEYDFNRQGSSD